MSSNPALTRIILEKRQKSLQAVPNVGLLGFLGNPVLSRIILENRKKAREDHEGLGGKLGPVEELPRYNQPCDHPIYRENQIKFASFKPRLQKYFQNKAKERLEREACLTSTHTKLCADWTSRVQKIEGGSKKKAEDRRSRAVFESVFPRKERDCSWDENEKVDETMRSLAVIPPLVLEGERRKRKWVNRNGLLREPLKELQQISVGTVWSEEEKKNFKEMFSQYPKNFGKIKTHLEGKSVAECVKFYYVMKRDKTFREFLKMENKKPTAEKKKPTGNRGRGRRKPIPTSNPVDHIAGCEEYNRVPDAAGMLQAKKVKPRIHMMTTRHRPKAET